MKHKDQEGDAFDDLEGEEGLKKADDGFEFDEDREFLSSDFKKGSWDDDGEDEII